MTGPPGVLGAGARRILATTRPGRAVRAAGAGLVAAEVPVRLLAAPVALRAWRHPLAALAGDEVDFGALAAACDAVAPPVGEARPWTAGGRRAPGRLVRPSSARPPAASPGSSGKASAAGEYGSWPGEAALAIGASAPPSLAGARPPARVRPPARHAATGGVRAGAPLGPAQETAGAPAALRREARRDAPRGPDVPAARLAHAALAAAAWRPPVPHGGRAAPPPGASPAPARPLPRHEPPAAVAAVDGLAPRAGGNEEPPAPPAPGGAPAELVDRATRRDRADLPAAPAGALAELVDRAARRDGADPPASAAPLSRTPVLPASRDARAAAPVRLQPPTADPADPDLPGAVERAIEALLRREAEQHGLESGA